MPSVSSSAGKSTCHLGVLYLSCVQKNLCNASLPAHKRQCQRLLWPWYLMPPLHLSVHNGDLITSLLCPMKTVCVWTWGSIQDDFISISCITVFFLFFLLLSSIGIQNPIPICACLRDAYCPAHRPHFLCMPQLELMFFFLMDIVSFQDYLTCPMAHTVII